MPRTSPRFIRPKDRTRHRRRTRQPNAVIMPFSRTPGFVDRPPGYFASARTASTTTWRINETHQQQEWRKERRKLSRPAVRARGKLGALH